LKQWATQRLRQHGAVDDAKAAVRALAIYQSVADLYALPATALHMEGTQKRWCCGCGDGRHTTAFYV